MLQSSEGVLILFYVCPCL